MLPINRRQAISRVAQWSFFSLSVTNLGMSSMSLANESANKSASTLPSDASPRQVAESYWRAECARDIERVGQHYHPDAIFMPPGERLVGWGHIRKWYEDSFRKFPGLEVQIAHEIRKENEAALEWKAVLIDTAQVRHPLTGVNIVRVEAGRFREVRAYFDPSALR